MAHLISGSNHLEADYKKYKRLSYIYGALALLCWVLHMPLQLPIITLPGLLIFAILSGRYGNKYQSLQAGLKGEQHTAELLAQLPDDTYVFQSLRINAGGGHSEIDNVIVSPAGVYVVETKNHNGKISGDAEERHWYQYKVGRRGTPYQNKFYSPVKQVGTHIYRLSQLFKAHGLNVWIEGAVYFSNDQAQLQIRNVGKIPVFSYHEAAQLLQYVSTKNNQGLTDHEIQRIVALLTQSNSQQVA